MIIDQAILSQLRVGKVQSHRVAQLSKASSKTHFQLVQRWSLPYKLVFTDPSKNVICGSKKVLLTFKNHCRDPVSGDLVWRERDF